MSSEEESINLGVRLVEILGASISTTQCLKIYLSNRDKDDNPLPDFEDWVNTALSVLTQVNGGATAQRSLQGRWLNRETGRTLEEEPVVVYSFLRNPQEFADNLHLVRELIHSYGQKTNQGEVLVEFDQIALRVDTFDP